MKKKSIATVITTLCLGIAIFAGTNFAGNNSFLRLFTNVEALSEIIDHYNDYTGTREGDYGCELFTWTYYPDTDRLHHYYSAYCLMSASKFSFTTSGYDDNHKKTCTSASSCASTSYCGKYYK